MSEGVPVGFSLLLGKMSLRQSNPAGSQPLPLLSEQQLSMQRELHRRSTANLPGSKAMHLTSR
jgi:hypothetical protein